MSHDASDRAGHVVPVPVYLAIFVALLVLTGVTVWVAFLDFGDFGFLHTPVALGIAGLKAAMVLLWFMHVKYSARLTWIFIAFSILWLAILMLVTLSDYASRGWDYRDEGWQAAAPVVETERPARRG